MTPQEKCVSLETAKKLKEAGYPQDTERMWEGIMHDVNEMRYKLKRFRQNGNPELFAAPDAQELGEKLPNGVFENVQKFDSKWTVVLPSLHGRSRQHFEHANEAEARAAAWLWLKEQKLI